MSNGGIIGPENKTSFGKNKVTEVTSSGCHSFQPGTTVANVAVVGGGGSGGNVGVDIAGGGGGAGGLALATSYSVCGTVPVTIGAGGAVPSNTSNPGNDTSVTLGSVTVTAKGGGKGGSYNSGTGPNGDGFDGGSGGGGSGPNSGAPDPCGGISTAGSATQPTQTAITCFSYYGNEGGS